MSQMNKLEWDSLIESARGLSYEKLSDKEYQKLKELLYPPLNNTVPWVASQSDVLAEDWLVVE